MKVLRFYTESEGFRVHFVKVYDDVSDKKRVQPIWVSDIEDREQYEYEMYVDVPTKEILACVSADFHESISILLSEVRRDIEISKILR